MANEPETGRAEGGDAVAPQDAPAAVDAAPRAEETPSPDATAADDVAARIASLEARLELAQAKGRETFEQLKQEHERHLRAAADLENHRKRALREREEIQKFGTERLLRDLLPVVDNLDRALGAASGDDPLSSGVRMVRRVLEEALAKHGVEVVSAMGKPFDPRHHEALAHLDVPGAEPGTVVAEHGRAFLLNGRLLRPALVAVAPPRPPQDG